MPAELFPQHTTMEYVLARHQAPSPPTYLFIIDTCVAEDELNACKEAVLQSLQMIPERCNVGLITFGTHVHVHELGFSGCPKSYVLRGSKEYSAAQIKDQLGLTLRVPKVGAQGPTSHLDPSTAGLGKFVVPLGDCEFILTSILEDLQVDPYPSIPEQRTLRCTGAALNVAAALVSASVIPGSCACRAILFVGGPVTNGPGRIVSPESAEPIRSHKDITKGDAPHMKSAIKFYSQLSRELVAAGCAVDAFVCSLEQVGLAEMKVAIERSGGITVLSDTFHNEASSISSIQP